MVCLLYVLVVSGLITVICASCNLNGTWLDKGTGGDATILQRDDGSLLATSLDPHSWTKATGAMSSPASLWMVFNSNKLLGTIEQCTAINWSNGAIWNLVSLPVGAVVGAPAFRVYPRYLQCDPRWGNATMGTPGPGERSTICGEGCAMSSVWRLQALDFGSRGALRRLPL